MAFAFGKNWSSYLEQVNANQIDAARDSLVKLIGRDDSVGKSFLDAGSGSGLFSLAAHQQGMLVTSFDVDASSVACTETLKKKFGHDQPAWIILQGSLTDIDFMNSLGEFDVVYCWGVAHHTGHMWKAIDHLLPRVRFGGRLILAIYNDQQHLSRAWSLVKQFYQRLPAWLRPIYVGMIGVLLWLVRAATTLTACILRIVTLRNPLIPIQNWFGEARARGMHGWYDLVDWVGGWPFEVAKPEVVFRFVRDRGFSLDEFVTNQGHGCNEFVFVRRHPI